jgi:hypothetical protein
VVVFCLLLSLSSSSRAHLRVVCVTVAKREKEVKIFFGFRPFSFARKKWEKRGASLSFRFTRKQHYSKHKRKMGFLGLGRKKKSEAELLEEERLRRQSLPWYARLFGTECCGNRGGKKEKKEEKKNNNGGA